MFRNFCDFFQIVRETFQQGCRACIIGVQMNSRRKNLSVSKKSFLYIVSDFQQKKFRLCRAFLDFWQKIFYTVAKSAFYVSREVFFCIIKFWKQNIYGVCFKRRRNFFCDFDEFVLAGLPIMSILCPEIHFCILSIFFQNS